MTLVLFVIEAFNPVFLKCSLEKLINRQIIQEEGVGGNQEGLGYGQLSSWG